jgi:hypothetical protein
MILRLQTLVLLISIMKIQIITEHWWNDTDRGKQRNRRKTCPSAAIPTIKLTWTCSGSNSGLRGKMPATNHLTRLKIEINLNYTNREQLMPMRKQSQNADILNVNAGGKNCNHYAWRRKKGGSAVLIVTRLRAGSSGIGFPVGTKYLSLLQSI